MRDRNSPFPLVTKPVAALRQLLDAVEGKLRVQVEREECLDVGWTRTERLIQVLEIVQAQLLGALFWNWKVGKKWEMLSRADKRFALRKRFGGLLGLEAWEGRAHASPLPLRCAQHLPTQGEGRGERTSFPLTGKVAEPKARSEGVRPIFRLARVRRDSQNNNAKSPALSRGLPREAEGVAYHDGGPASARGNLRRDYQIEVWPIELMWRRERRARASRRSTSAACGGVRGRSRGIMRAAGRRTQNYRERFEPRVRGSPWRAAA